MASNNPYYSEEQRKRLLAGKQPEKQKIVRQITASLDKDAMRELKDINDNTLETALNTLDIKDGLKSFETKFSEKFAGFKDQLNENADPLAEQLPDFVGPSRPANLNDNSSSNINNNVNVNSPNADVFGKIEKHSDRIVNLLTELITISKKKPDSPEDEPAPPRPEPEEEAVVDRGKKKKDKKDKDDDNFRRSLMKTLGLIQGGVSGLLSRFIGYTLESLANIAKWTLLLGALVFGFDVLKNVITKWFDDILADGESSKELFGSYFEQVKRITQSIDDGLKNFDMKNLSGSLANLLGKPFALLGVTIKTAITESIGKMISALGVYMGSDSMQDMGRGMQISALRDKQAAGMAITKENMAMLLEAEMPEAKDKATKSANEAQLWKNRLNEKKDTTGAYGNYSAAYVDPNSDEGIRRAQEQAGFQKKYDAAQAEATAAAERLANLQKSLASQSQLQKLTDEENERNKQRVNDADKLAAEQEANHKELTDHGFKQMDDVIDKEDVTTQDRALIDKIFKGLEEKHNAGKLNESDDAYYLDRLRDWQDRWQMKPDSTAGIDPKPKPAAAPTDTAATNNVNVNNKTIHNNVQQSVQRTERKPLVGLS